MTTLSAHQPAFMAGPGFYRRIAKSDVFVMLLGVQFERGSHINRNRIPGPNGNRWLTIPLMMNGHMNGSISTMEVARSKPWRKNHRAVIHHQYAKATRFQDNWPKLKDHYDGLGEKQLSKVLTRDYVFWMNELGMAEKLPGTIFDFSPAVRSKELAALCKEHEADTYLSGPLGMDYLDLEAFKKEGIEVVFDTPIPDQLSVLDHWMHKKGNPWKALS